MSDPWLWMLIAKMAVAAAVVVGCSLLAERSGPLLAAMIATLPISAGPVYVFLALEHDPAFIAAGAVGSVASNLANSGLLLVYVTLAQQHRTLPSLGAALAVWLALVLTLRWLDLPLAVLVIATLLCFAALHQMFRPYLAIRAKDTLPRRWYALPLRATCVALLAGGVTTASRYVGPAWSGVMAALPIVLSSLIAMVQPRIGGPAMAAVIANGALGLIGFGLALASLNLTVVPLGSAAGLALALLLCIGWNLGLIWLGRRTRRAAP